MKIITEEANCPLCGQINIDQRKTISTQDFAFASSEDTYHYTLCVKCDLYFLQNRPIAAELSKIYPQNYSGWSKRSRFMHYMRKRNFKSKFLISEPTPNSVVLDYGCGNGEFISSINNLTKESVGFDFTLDQIPAELQQDKKLEFAKDHSVLQTRAQFDRIFLLQVIEHLPDPVETIIFLKSLLATDGRIVIETPSRTGWDSKIKPNKFWGGWHAPRHFHIWGEESLTKLSDAVDMKMISKTYLPSPYQWAETLKPLAPKSLRGFISSDKVVFVVVVYLVDLFQIFVLKKSSNLRVVLVKN